MLPQFVDRQKELQFLETLYKRDGFNLVVIYGRRRVGKTELIKKFMENKRGCYILLTNESLKENLKYIKESFATVLGKDYYARLEVNSFYELFKYVDFGEDKFIIALDEFPYLLEINKGLLTTFQKIIDEILSKRNVMLILCGSSLSMMENDILGYRSPLYGRNVNVWKLQPFDFKTIYSIFGDIYTAINVFFTFGNIPYYISFYDPNKSLEENIRDVVLTKGMNLYDEPLILLRQEFRESRIYRLILKYISQGYKSIGKLCSATGMDKSNLSKYLETLKETGIVEHIVPFGKKRGGIYEILDPFMDFWFRYVYPYRGDLEIGNIEKVLKIFSEDKKRYFGYKYEKLVLHLLKMKVFPELQKYKEYTKWWHKGEEIDIVGINKNALLLCECKWREDVDGEKILEEMKNKSKLIKWNGKIEYAIFAKSFCVRPENAYTYDLKDIEKAISK